MSDDKQCPIDWTGKRYPCCFAMTMGRCSKLSGGCLPGYEAQYREELRKKGYPDFAINDMLNNRDSDYR